MLICIAGFVNPLEYVGGEYPVAIEAPVPFSSCSPAQSTYSSSEMTRLSSSSSSSSASSSPVLFTSSHSQTPTSQFHDPTEENGDTGVVERRYGGPPARDAALVIQRAFRRYSMVKEFQRIKTERRLSRRINNHVAPTPGTNGCEICIDLHEEVETLDDDEDSSIQSGELPRVSSGCAEVTEVEVEVDQAILSQATSNNSQSTGQLLQNYVPLQSCLHNNIHLIQNHQQGNNHHHHHHHRHHHHHSNSSHPHHVSSAHNQSSPTKLNNSHSDNNVSSSRHPQNQMHRHHIPTHYQQHPQQPQPQTAILGQPQGYSSIAIATGGDPSSNNASNQFSPNSSPLQQPKTNSSSPLSTPMSNISPNLSSCSVSSGSPSSNNIKGGSGNVSGGSSGSGVQQMTDAECEIVRKRLYRVGLNLFNKKPETGITYLVKKKFLEGSAPAVARFLISRKGLSKQMIGEYLANLQSPFSMACLEHFASEIDLASLPIDLALRRFQTYLRMPGEAQKIERVMESFSRRYAACNPHLISQFRNGADTVFVMAFAIIMLNTDLHTPHLKQDRRMKMEDFIKNLRGIDDGGDIDREVLVGIYERIKQTEFKTGSDHVTQVMKVQQTIVGKKPNLALPHRRLVCYCRLYEVADINKREKTGSHQREVFLFNDILVLTKIFHKKRNSVTYSFRQSYPLQGITLALFANQHFEFGLSLKRGDTVLLNLNARNEHDRAKFTEDLREAIAESDEMGRIESLSKENRDRDSGVDVGKIKRFSNSLLDINDQCKPTRRGSCGSLDSGMSVSFHSDEIHQQQLQQASHHHNIHLHHQNIQPSISLAISHPPLPQHQHSHQGSSCSSSSQSSHK